MPKIRYTCLHCQGSWSVDAHSTGWRTPPSRCPRCFEDLGDDDFDTKQLKDRPPRERPKTYEQGRADERADWIAWLEKQAADRTGSAFAPPYWYAAKSGRRGEHIGAADKEGDK